MSSFCVILAEQILINLQYMERESQSLYDYEVSTLRRLRVYSLCYSNCRLNTVLQ